MTVPPRIAYNETLSKKWLAEHGVALIYHLFSDYKADPDTERRQRIAKETWATQWWIELPVQDADLPRRWEEEKRRLPFLKDLFDLACKGKSDVDVIIYTNADICVASGCSERIQLALQTSDACFAFRMDFDSVDGLLDNLQVAKGEKYQGVDLVAFRVRWWKKNRDQFPDMLVGVEAWDAVMRRLIQLTNSGPTEIPNCIYHEKHSSVWNMPENRYRLESQKHCLKLAKDWLLARGEKPEQFGIQTAVAKSNKIVVVFPVCLNDVQLAIRHGDWLMKLGKWQHDAVIAYDQSLTEPFLKALGARLQSCFRSVSFFRYPTPPVLKWPQAPNWAFQHTARRMAELGSPWLWMEADSVALRKDWIELLQAEYDQCGKPLMGPVVPNSLHVNGGAVYPANFATLSPKAMGATELAFDSEMKVDMQDKSFNSPLFQHLWGVVDGKPHPNNGPAPSRLTVEQARAWINCKAATVHRIKDDSLITLLMEGKI